MIMDSTSIKLLTLDVPDMCGVEMNVGKAKRLSSSLAGSW